MSFNVREVLGWVPRRLAVPIQQWQDLRPFRSDLCRIYMESMVGYLFVNKEFLPMCQMVQWSVVSVRRQKPQYTMAARNLCKCPLWLWSFAHISITSRAWLCKFELKLTRRLAWQILRKLETCLETCDLWQGSSSQDVVVLYSKGAC